MVTSNYSSEWIWVAASVIVVGLIIAIMFWRKWHATTLTISLLLFGNISFAATKRDRELAWKLYVQLITRKAALPFDRDYDVVLVIHESLYQLFPATRDLLLDIADSENTMRSEVPVIMERILNGRIRPYLTRWHSDFAAWEQTNALTDTVTENSPRERQRGFPEYDALVADLETLNDELSEFATELRAIAVGRDSTLQRFGGKFRSTWRRLRGEGPKSAPPSIRP